MPAKKSEVLKGDKSHSKTVKPGKTENIEDMQAKLLKEVVEYIVGPDMAGIVDLLSGKKNVNEFAIAEKLKITINQTRNILYKLSDVGLVSFVRKKDKKNGGWYTYFWTLETGKSLDNLKQMINNKIKGLEANLNLRSKERFYYCPVCELEYNEEDALQNLFSCVECGGVLELKDNKQIIDELQKEIARLKRNLEIVEGEHGKVMKKEEAVISRKARAEERKKKLEREEKRKKREKEKKKEQEKSGIVKKAKTPKKAEGKKPKSGAAKTKSKKLPAKSKRERK